MSSSSSALEPHEQPRGRDVARGEQAPRPPHEPGSVTDSPPPPPDVEEEVRRGAVSDDEPDAPFPLATCRFLWCAVATFSFPGA
ncbi:hypothetical protein PR202_gb11235 [Eleusine coracana subsp. coracana]|uniref:Uncharacterized protein n=1 Tax=Eleusine coracana subsp. coracana TaxID=191504 RepID=A0AAV5EMI8_ELECO|nr:hypothetical protein PR202_gb11235 [Eleusine coracana subsp. coracana]